MALDIIARRERQNKRNSTPGEYRDRRLARRRKWRQENKDRISQREAEKYAADPEHRREIAKRSYWKNVEKNRARIKRWQADNKDKRQKYMDSFGREKMKKWKEANKDKLQEYQKRYRTEKKDAKYASIHKRRAQKKNSTGQHTSADLADILRMQKHRCAHPGCGADLRKVGRHLDHIIPLALGGSNDRRNLQFLCPPHNLSKGAKHPIVFARTLGLLL